MSGITAAFLGFTAGMVTVVGIILTPGGTDLCGEAWPARECAGAEVTFEVLACARTPDGPLVCELR